MRMRKRRFLALALIMTLTLSALTPVCAETAPAVYKLGDKPADFTVTLADGQETSLYGLLAEKKAVLLNFWASWCGPCQKEFPYLQEAYDQLSDDVGMIALSIHDGDTNEQIKEFKTQHGLTTLPMGRDIGLAAQYGVVAYPTTILIDRNGVICLIHEGIITSTRILTNALEMLTVDDYAAPVLLEEMPPVSMAEAPGAEELSAALNAEGGTLSFGSLQSEDGIWPFLPSQDGSSAVPSNLDMQGSNANVGTEVTVKAGDVLLYDCRMNGKDFADRLVFFVQDDVKALHTGSFGWTTEAYRFETEGTYQAGFIYIRGDEAGYAAECELRNVRLLTGDEAAAYELPASTAVKTLPGTEISLDIPENAKKVVPVEGSVAGTQALAYILDADTVRLKLRIGADVDERFAGVTVTNDLLTRTSVMLSNLEHDDEGYFYTLDLSKTTMCAVVQLNANMLDATATTANITLCTSEEMTKKYILMFMGVVLGSASQEQIDTMTSFGFGYEDGQVFYTSEEIIATLQEQNAPRAEAPATLSFTITFVDEAGHPIPNVMAQICDDATCNVIPSDENGVVRFEGENHAYDLHVLMAPAGYQAPADAVALPEAGGEVTVTLQTLLP